MQVGTETNGTLNMKWIKTTINLLSFNPTKVRHTQTIVGRLLTNSSIVFDYFVGPAF